MLQSGRRSVGASTITQQVAKNFLLSSDQTVERKLKEAILAIRIERAFTKEQILELYLNEIYLGVGAYGVAAAAQSYWDKALNELTLADCAYLATLAQGAEQLRSVQIPRPRRGPPQLGHRPHRRERLRHQGRGRSRQGSAARRHQAHRAGPKIFASEYFAEEVRREILDRFGEDKLYGGGLSVRTTLDPRLQRVARKALIDGFVAFDRRRGGWRGPVKQIEIKGDWGTTLAAMPVWTDIAPWRLAVVLEATKDKAVVGIRPGRTPAGQLEKERETGIIPFEEVKWARPKLEQRSRRGAGIGDRRAQAGRRHLCFAARARTRRRRHAHASAGRTQRPMVAQQVPEIGGALGRHGSPYRARARHRRRLQLRRRASSTARRRRAASRDPRSSRLIYTTALDNGYTPSSIIVDGPICLDQGAGMPQWCPKNYDAGSAAGPSTLRFGIEKSRNLMTVRLASEMGMPIIVEYSKRFGVYDNLMPALSMALGAGETTLLRMVTGYSMLVQRRQADQGRPSSIAFRTATAARFGVTISATARTCAAREWSGQQEPELVDDRKQVLDPMSAFQMTSIMEGVVQSGTAQRLKVLEAADRRQDRHHQRLQGRVVRRLHARPRRRRLYRLRPAGLHGPWRDRRKPRRADRARLLEGGAEGRAAGAVPRAARHQARARQPQDRPAAGRRRQDGHRGGVQAGPGARGLGRVEEAVEGRRGSIPSRRTITRAPPPTAAARPGQPGPSARQRPRFDIGYRRPLLDPIFSRA